MAKVLEAVAGSGAVRRRSRAGKFLALTALVAGAAFVGGCGSEQNVDLTRGRQLFIANCGTCHQLAQAATSAQVGPNLDYAFKAARAAGMPDETIQGVVHTQIGHPRTTDLHPNDPGYSKTYMPRDLVTGQDAEDVAAYVGKYAGLPGAKPPVAPGGPGGQVFAANGCGSCHVLKAAQSNGNTGPSLDEVLPGMSAKMIQTSIVNPNAKIATGYPANVMPQNFGQTINAKDLKTLVDFLVSNAGKK